MDGVSRRAFIANARDAAALATIATALRPLSALAATGTSTGDVATPVYFDLRFPAARAMAAQLAGGGAVTAISGDATELLFAASSGASQPVMLRGVTTESVPFCLSQAVVKGKRPKLIQTRLDQDLFAWSLEFSA
jgi:hypothetical protein